MQTQLLHHLTDAQNIVVAAADKRNQRLPSVLIQDADACEGGGAAREVGVGEGPLGVECGQAVGEGEVVV